MHLLGTAHEGVLVQGCAGEAGRASTQAARRNAPMSTSPGSARTACRSSEPTTALQLSRASAGTRASALAPALVQRPSCQLLAEPSAALPLAGPASLQTSRHGSTWLSGTSGAAPTEQTAIRHALRSAGWQACVSPVASERCWSRWLWRPLATFSASSSSCAFIAWCSWAAHRNVGATAHRPHGEPHWQSASGPDLTSKGALRRIRVECLCPQGCHSMQLRVVHGRPGAAPVYALCGLHRLASTAHVRRSSGSAHWSQGQAHLTATCSGAEAGWLSVAARRAW